MASKNPYRRIEKAGELAVNIFVGILVGFIGVAFALYGVLQCLKAGWGWWTLTLIVIEPGIVAGFVAILVAFGVGASKIGDVWSAKSRKWERDHA